MKRTRISSDWYLKGPEDHDFHRVDLPNDYTICMPRKPDVPGGAANGFFPGGIGEYIKYIRPEAARHYQLEMDGAYMCTTVFLNENFLCMHPHGYTPWLVDLTDELLPERNNKLSIITSGLQCSTRWYSGAGLYRDVYLWTGGDTRIEPRDLYVTTGALTDTIAIIQAHIKVTSDVDLRVELVGRILDSAGNVAATFNTSTHISNDTSTELCPEITISNPLPWSPDHPDLYTLELDVIQENEVLDSAQTTFGIRTISADAEHGFLLNGIPMKMRGGCIHHDHGVLGAAAFPAAEERKVRLLKEAGFNAIRIAHNPPSLALLEACDRQGMLVMDEAFDMWRNGKREYDYHLFFEDWWDRDVKAMIERDRSHPCVISYSIGNEIRERDCSSHGAQWARKISDEIRKYDNTRFITSGINSFFRTPAVTDPTDYTETLNYGCQDRGEAWAELGDAFMKPLDIVGYNYAYSRYAPDHERCPDRVIWGSETHAIDFYDSWNATLENNHVIGDFTWTAYDNLGEAGTGRALWARDGFIPGISLADYPWRTCYQGDLDLCGYRRPQSFFRESVWLPGGKPHIVTTHPEHYGEGYSGTHWHWYDVSECWTFDDAYLGQPVKVEVYTDEESVAFILNGETVATSNVIKNVATAAVNYEKGILRCIAYKDGKVCGEDQIETTGPASCIQLKPEAEQFKADFRDLCYFRISITDIEGRLITDAANELECCVQGATLMGIFSGDPKNEDQYTSRFCHAFKGRALAIVRSSHPGTVTITVKSSNLSSASVSVKAIAE